MLRHIFSQYSLGYSDKGSISAQVTPPPFLEGKNNIFI